MMLTKVRGHFGKLKGSLVLASGETVPSAIDADNHPRMTFKSTRVEKKAANEFNLSGDLAIRGTTKAITLHVEAEGRIIDPYGKDRAAYTAKGKLNRKDFGLSWNQALETGGVVVADEVEIELEIEAVAG